MVARVAPDPLIVGPCAGLFGQEKRQRAPAGMQIQQVVVGVQLQAFRQPVGGQALGFFGGRTGLVVPGAVVEEGLTEADA